MPHADPEIPIAIAVTLLASRLRFATDTRRSWSPALLALLALGALPVAAPQAGGAAWDDFPAFVWRLRHKDAEPPAALLAGFGGVDVKRGEDAAWADHLALYLGHAPGRDDLHLDADDPAWRAPWRAWVDEGHARGGPQSAVTLAREPCLSDPRTRARLDATLAATLLRHADRAPLFASLGDEVSLTPSQGVPWDGCRSSHCRAAWEARRRARTGESAAPMPTTDAVRRAWAAGGTDALGAWLDLRRFHRGVVEDEVLRLGGATKLPVGLLGTIGATPFGGVDLARILPALDVVECYAEGDARADVETLRTLPAARPLRSLRTVFVADDAPAGAAWQVSEHWVRGGDGVVIWCDADLEDRPEHAARLRRVLGEVRGLELEHLPAPAGVAVLRDDDSRALAFLDEARLDGPTWPNRFPSHQARHGQVEIAVAGWLRLAEDLGLHPGVVRFDTLDAARFPVVVAPHVRVAGARDEAALERFLSAGGVLLVAGELGTHDRDGRPSPPDRPAASERFAERFPDQVLLVDCGDYAEHRLAWSPARRAALLPPRARDALAAAGRAPLPIASADGTPWLVTRTPRAGGGLLVAAVPNLVTPAERARLADARITPPSAPGLRVVRHLPADATGDEVVVPAGSALVYELVPER